MSLMTLKKAGDDAIFATGVLLRDLIPLLKADVPRGQIFRARPSRCSLGELATYSSPSPTVTEQMSTT